MSSIQNPSIIPDLPSSSSLNGTRLKVWNCKCEAQRVFQSLLSTIEGFLERNQKDPPRTTIRMAYRRSITSSHSSDNTPPTIVSISSDSSVSYASGTSGRYRRMHRRPESEPRSPTPEESFEDDEENVHPAHMREGERYPSEDEEDTSDYPVYLQPVQPLQERIPDEELAEVMARFEAQSSHTGPDGFGAGSSVAAELQHHMNVANRRVEELEGMVGGLRAVEEENEELLARVADMTVANVMMGIGHQASDVFVSSVNMCLVVVIVLVVALIVRGW